MGTQRGKRQIRDHPAQNGEGRMGTSTGLPPAALCLLIPRKAVCNNNNNNNNDDDNNNNNKVSPHWKAAMPRPELLMVREMYLDPLGWFAGSYDATAPS